MNQSTKRKVQSTTWPLRHEETFTSFSSHLSQIGSQPAVLEVGPGAATKFLSPYYPAAGIGEKLSWFEGRKRFILRKLDSVLRRIPGIELCSFEPGELRRFMPESVRHFVADISAEVIGAISKQYPQVKATVYDFSQGPFSEKVDAIVCLCVLVRAKDAKILYANLYKSLNPGGLLVMDNRSVRSFGAPEFPLEPLANQVFRKPA